MNQKKNYLNLLTHKNNSSNSFHHQLLNQKYQQNISINIIKTRHHHFSHIFSPVEPTKIDTSTL